jgi:hypothetical protein
MRILRRLALLLVLVCALALAALLAIHKDSAIRTEIWIDSTPDQVWTVLTATADYPAWNPLITRLDGDLREGNTITFTQGAGSDAMTFQPRILRARPGKELVWKGSLWMAGIFDAERHFEMQAQGGGTRFTQRESFSGLLAGKLTADAVQGTEDGMRTMNNALKTRVESLAAQR